jgi:N-acetylneuraminic acid mutarotase
LIGFEVKVMSSFIKRTKETKPQGRAGHLLLNDLKNKCIYLIGGYNDEGPLDDIYRYDYKINKWTKLITTSKLSPLPRLECDCCLINNDNSNVYLFGGVQNIDDQVLIYNDLWHFNTNKLTWICTAEETPVSERSGHVMLSISDKAYLWYCNKAKFIL